METIIIKIQSLSSVITNSSSEIFQINVDMPENTFKDIWIRLLNKYEEGWDEYPLTDTYLGTIESIEDHIEVRFPVMCNIGTEMRDALIDLFGEENVDWMEY